MNSSKSVRWCLLVVIIHIPINVWSAWSINYREVCLKSSQIDKVGLVCFFLLSINILWGYNVRHIKADLDLPGEFPFNST